MSSPSPETNKTSLLEFPCRFPVKAMGRRGPEFEALIKRIVSEHADLWPDEPVQTRPSKAGNYVSVTAVVEARSQEQLDAIYRDLTNCPEVLMAL